MELDKYTKEMLFTNITNEYSDKEQLDIIEYLVETLKALQVCYELKNGSIEKIYYKGLEKVLADIKELKKQEKDFYKEN